MNDLTPWQRDVEDRQRNLEARVGALEKGRIEMQRLLDENTDLTKEVRDNTADIVNLLKGSRVAGKVVAFFGGIAAAFSAVGALVYGLWYFIRHGGPAP